MNKANYYSFQKLIIFMLLFIVIFLYITNPLYASVRRLCKISYQTQYGWSDEYTMEVMFMTGQELNNATNSYQYQYFSNYCLVWFGEGKVAILRINTQIFGVGEEFYSDDFKRLFQFNNTVNCTQINARTVKYWKIRAKDYFKFIDPREE